MTYRTIFFDTSDAIATIWLNRPEEGNVLTAEVRRELMHAIGRAEAEARSLLLSARGVTFCAGQDLGEAATLGRVDLEQVVGEEFGPLASALADASIPTVAAVDGLAAGAGAALALAADLCIASEGAKFLFPSVRMGLIPDTGATYWLPRRVGRGRAMGLALLGEAIDARRAADWGLIWDVVPGTDLQVQGRALARRLADGPARAYSALREAMRESDANTLGEQLALEARLQGRLGETYDFREGVMAVHEDRTPEFRGK